MEVIIIITEGHDDHDYVQTNSPNVIMVIINIKVMITCMMRCGGWDKGARGDRTNRGRSHHWSAQGTYKVYEDNDDDAVHDDEKLQIIGTVCTRIIFLIMRTIMMIMIIGLYTAKVMTMENVMMMMMTDLRGEMGEYRR